MKYRKKPVVIDAWKWDESKALLDEIGAPMMSCSGHKDTPGVCHNLRIKTLEGTMHVEPGDFIIKGVAGEYYPCKPDIFEATYEKMSEREEEL